MRPFSASLNVKKKEKRKIINFGKTAIIKAKKALEEMKHQKDTELFIIIFIFYYNYLILFSYYFQYFLYFCYFSTSVIFYHFCHFFITFCLLVIFVICHQLKTVILYNTIYVYIKKI